LSHAKHHTSIGNTAVHPLIYLLFIPLYYLKNYLLVIPEENLDWQPSIPTDLETIWQTIQLLNLLSSQIPTIKLKIRLNSLLVNGLGNDGPALLHTPCEEYLLRSLALGLGEAEESLVLVERGVGATEAGVSGAVDTLGGVVCYELWGGVVGVEFDLVDCWDDLVAKSGQQDPLPELQLFYFAALLSLMWG